MIVPQIPSDKFNGKAVLVLTDHHPLGFMEKCPIIAVGELFFLPDGKSAGTIVKVFSGSAENELVASCSFETNKHPFTFRVCTDAREVATYYQRTWMKRFERRNEFTHTINIKVSDGIPHFLRNGEKSILYPLYWRKSWYKKDTFKTFFEEYQKEMMEDKTITLYGKKYTTCPCSYLLDHVETRLVLTRNDMRTLLASAKTAKQRWWKYYVDSGGKEKELKKTYKE